MTSPASTPPIIPVKALLFVLALLPLGRLLFAAVNNDFGPEPEQFVQRWTGIWTLNFLLLTLCLTPLRGLTQWHWLIRLRRMLGLFTFFYASLHLLSFIGFDNEFVASAIAQDIIKRPYTIIGFAAFALMLPLAATSNSFSIRNLGGRRWQELHRSIYLISILAMVHYFWQSKMADMFWPIGYAIVLSGLLGWRVLAWRRKAQSPKRFPEAKPLRFFKQKPD
jgi:methionine sulfoxide reductase heme-binding subunit